MNPVSDKLIAWYNANKRELPWRDTTDPYKIWLSEIMLQQTQVVQGLNYYIKFTGEFPTLVHLANAPEDKVMRLWQGLGYYSRARNLHTAAKSIRDEYKGKFPSTYEQIRQLKGVGDYTAAAIASLAFNLPHAVVDGNVYRVLSRLYDVDTPINSTAGKKVFQELADMLLNTKYPGLHNSAMMEFGALWCKPVNPKCEACVLQEHCLAYKNKTVNQRPVKDKKLKIKTRYFNYFIINHGNDVYVQKRMAKDIWQEMYEFYLIETEQETPEDVMLGHKQLKKLVKKFRVLSVVRQKKHILSHQHIYSTIYELATDTPLQNAGLKKVKRGGLSKLPFPVLLLKYMDGSSFNKS